MSATVFRGRSRLGFLPDSDLASGFAAAFFGLPAEALAEVRATFATAAFLAAVFFFATARLAGFAAFLAADFFADSSNILSIPQIASAPLTAALSRSDRQAAAVMM